MANQENARPTPFDVDPHWVTNDDPELGRLQDPNMTADLMRRVYLPLYHAAIRGDWRGARNFVNEYGADLSTARITETGDTVLMVAAKAFQWQFVTKLAALVSPAALAMQESDGFTVLHYVARGGSLKTAKALVKKNSALPQIQSVDGRTPLLFSLARPNKEMAWYLTLTTREESPSSSCPFTGTTSGELVFNLVIAGFTDIAFYIVKRYGLLAFNEESIQSDVLRYLVVTPSIFLGGSKLKCWERWILKFVPAEFELPPDSIFNASKSLGNRVFLTEMSNSIQSSRGFVAQVLYWFKLFLRKAAEILVPAVRDAKLQHICAIKLVEDICERLASSMNIEDVAHYLESPIYVATNRGAVEIARIFFQYFPELIYRRVNTKKGKMNILQVAIEARQANIINLINEVPLATPTLACSMLESAETTLFLAAKLAPSPKLLSVSGPALQMQRELQWFKEVEKLMHPAAKGMLNAAGKTAEEVFREEHKNLAKKGEKWMKDTANFSVFGPTLVATVMFATAFTVPGGNINDKGIPIFLGKNLFIVFVISDALALFSSITSLLMFLSIPTARYTQEDFLLALPQRLIIGFGSLFFSMITMMVAFGATLFIVLGERWQWVYLPIIFLASIPVITFGSLQLPLFFFMVKSTYRPGIFQRYVWH